MIYFVRHGESEANLRSVFAGSKDDSLLTDKGKDQAKRTAEIIKEENLKIDRIISSPLKRTLNTAEIIAEEIGFDKSKIITDDRIIEYDLGSLSGAPWNPVIDLANAVGAEAPLDFYNRINTFFKEISSIEGNTLIVSHGIVSRMLKTIKENLKPENFVNMKPYPNASVTIY